MEAPSLPDYYSWLVRKTGVRRASYSILLRQLYATPFRWSIHNDDNRAEDGKELRERFAQLHRIREEDLWLDSEASVLEVLLALAARLEYDTDILTERWFWKFIENLGLHHYHDNQYNTHVEEDVDDTVRQVLDRRYSADGTGGLFPLRRAQHDQRRVELWAQSQAYLLESDFVDNLP